MSKSEMLKRSAGAKPGIEPLRSALRATAILSSSSVVSILVGLVSAKLWAVILGPSGLGFMGLLQSLVALAGLLAGAGLGTGLVRAGANALARDDHMEVAALRRAAWLLFWGMGGLAVLIMTVFRSPISTWMLGSPEHAWGVVLMALALLFSLASGVQISVLNAFHRIRALATCGILNSIFGTGISLVLIWVWREQGIAPAIIGGTVVGWATTRWFLTRDVGTPPVRPTRSATLHAARELLRFGAPYSASMLVGTGVQFALPALVLHSLGTESVGFYRAAIAISITYMGFLLNAMTMDYYPRVSAASDKPAILIQLINQQQRLLMILAVPLILGVLALAPYLVPLIYSPEFAPTVEVLEWQLIGDLFKFASWNLGTVILARGDSTTIFVVELIAGIGIVAFSLLGMRWLGLAGMGAAFLATYIVHYLVVWAVLRRDIQMVWTRANKGLLLAAISAALIVRGLSFVGLEDYRTAVALSLSLLAGTLSVYTIWQEVIKGGVGRQQDSAIQQVEA